MFITGSLMLFLLSKLNSQMINNKYEIINEMLLLLIFLLPKKRRKTREKLWPYVAQT